MVTPSPISILQIACVALLITSGFLQKRAVDRWTQSTGRAPLIQRNRGSWGAYMRANKHEMPHSVLKQISIWKWVCYSALALLMLTFFFEPSSHRAGGLM